MTPVEVSVQTGILTNYGTNMVSVPVYLNNSGFDSIGGFTLYFNSSTPEMIDYSINIDTTGGLVNGFDYLDVVADGDTSQIAGDYISIVGISDQGSGYYIMPQTSGLLLTLKINVSASCDIISDTNLATLYVAPFISLISDPHGNLIPSDSSDADTLILNNGSAEAPGELVLGDVDGSCKGNPSCNPSLGDVVFMVNHLFNKPGFGFMCQPDAADTNCNGSFTLADVVTLVNHLFNKPGFEVLCP